jgi:hypothetical protein
MNVNPESDHPPPSIREPLDPNTYRNNMIRRGHEAAGELLPETQRYIAERARLDRINTPETTHPPP